MSVPTREAVMAALAAGDTVFLEDVIHVLEKADVRTVLKTLQAPPSAAWVSDVWQLWADTHLPARATATHQDFEAKILARQERQS